MPLVETGSIVAEAALDRVAAAAFNVITLEHAEAIVAGAERVGQPVILQISENAVRFHHGRLGPIAAAARAVAGQAAVPVALHLDHVESVDLLHQAPEHGFSSVMVDASALPYADNVAATAAAVRFGRDHGLWVESELGTVGGKDGAAPLSPHAPGARTDPAEAAAYVAETGVDALAVAVGSSHARLHRDAVLNHQLIAALAAQVKVPLVLHGSSGVPDEELRRAVAGGLVKVNIGTALNIAFTGTVTEALVGTGSPPVDPRKYLAPARAAMADTVAHFLTVLGRPGPAVPSDPA
ncbi:class II fructose-bisphosphate aldolase family protein [Micromonospora sonneratiae]|uniref:Ketose-bisphosphate aldolase n=1 Tax=Micromonospora sonneratiae TaxID=1184706 RepID=A0ABW3Y8C8_9ACTN